MKIVGGIPERITTELHKHNFQINSWRLFSRIRKEVPVRIAEGILIEISAEIPEESSKRIFRRLSDNPPNDFLRNFLEEFLKESLENFLKKLMEISETTLEEN